MDITDSRGKFRTDFTQSELAEFAEKSPERVPLFDALRAANKEGRASEEALREATAKKIACVTALAAAEVTLRKIRPPVSEYDAVKAHHRSLGYR